MFSWKVLWSTVLTLTVHARISVLNAATMSANAFFGTASE